jgi:hypothetical protein
MSIVWDRIHFQVVSSFFKPGYYRRGIMSVHHLLTLMHSLEEERKMFTGNKVDVARVVGRE